jgi:hypothetical protein
VMRRESAGRARRSDDLNIAITWREYDTRKALTRSR